MVEYSDTTESVPHVEGCGDGTEGSRVGACGDGSEGSPVAKSVGEARPLFVLLAVERLLDMGHELALRCKRIEQVEEGRPSM